jgi:hypothetical protein
MQVQLSGEEQVPLKPEQAIGSVDEKQIGVSQVLPMYPTLHTQESGFSHLPCPLQTFGSFDNFP